MTSIRFNPLSRSLARAGIAVGVALATVGAIVVPTASGDPEVIPADAFQRTVAGVRFTVSASPEWEEHSGTLSITKSERGPQGAEAIVFWTSFPRARQASPCTKVLSRPVRMSPAGLAAVVAAAPGTRLVSGPADVEVGGRAAKRVVIRVRSDAGCHPGFFYAFRREIGGAFWPETNVGDTIRVWIVPVRGKLLFFEAETAGSASTHLAQEVQRIVESIRFG